MAAATCVLMSSRGCSAIVNYDDATLAVSSIRLDNSAGERKMRFSTEIGGETFGATVEPGEVQIIPLTAAIVLNSHPRRPVAIVGRGHTEMATA